MCQSYNACLDFVSSMPTILVFLFFSGICSGVLIVGLIKAIANPTGKIDKIISIVLLLVCVGVFAFSVYSFVGLLQILTYVLIIT